jgi:hypothetical protein
MDPYKIKTSVNEVDFERKFDRIIIEYKFTFIDYCFYIFSVFSKSKPMLVTMLLANIFILLNSIQILGENSNVFLDLFVMLFMHLVFSISAFVFVAILVLVQAYFNQDAFYINVSQRFVISNNGIYTKTDRGRSVIYWRAFKKCWLTNKYFVLKYPNGMAHIVKRVEFSEHVNLDYVCELINEKITRSTKV